MKWAAIIGGVLICALGGLGLAKATLTPSFDYEAASPIDRQAWLDSQASGIASDVREGLDIAGAKVTQMALQDLIISDEKKLLDIVIVVKGSTRTHRPKDFRMEFLGKMCPEYQDTHLAKLGFRMRLKLVRENGDIALSENVSRGACKQYKDFLKRQRT